MAMKEVQGKAFTAAYSVGETGSGLQLQPTWIREMGNARVIYRRQSIGNRENTSDRAVSSLGHLGYATKIKTPFL